MIEKVKDILNLPIFIDLDLKYKKNERYHNLEIIKLIINLYNKHLNKIFEDVDLRVYVLERESIYKSNGIYKDGLHIIYPLIVTTREVLYYLREEVLKEIDEILSNLPLKNSYMDIIDRSVYCNGLGMYGSTKVGLSGYKLIKIYDKDLNECKFPSLYNILSNLSLRNKGDLSKLKINIPIEEEIKVIKAQINIELTDERKKFYLEVIYNFDSSDYETFIKVCWIMYNEGFELKDFQEWSKSNELSNKDLGISKYNSNDNIRYWNNQINNTSEIKVKIGTLLRDLKELDNNKYKMICKKNKNLMIEYKNNNKIEETMDDILLSKRSNYPHNKLERTEDLSIKNYDDNNKLIYTLLLKDKINPLNGEMDTNLNLSAIIKEEGVQLYNVLTGEYIPINPLTLKSDHKQQIFINVYNNTINNNGTMIINNNEDKYENKNTFEVLCDYLKADCKKNNYKKEDGYILGPYKNVLNYYKKYLSYDEYINNLYTDENSKTYKLYQNNPNNHDNIVKYLNKYNTKELSNIKRDKYLYSYLNGNLDIKDIYNLKFKSFKSGLCSKLLIDEEFEDGILLKEYNEISTPIFDKIVKNQIKKEEVYIIFLGFLGRLLYKTNEHDKWQCMLLISGTANTGKSLICEIMETYFDANKVGIISGNFEEKFGLGNLINSDIVLSGDMPDNMDKLLDRTLFQSMITGESLSAPIKGKKSKVLKWDKPLFFASNYLPSYKDANGSISRRIAVIYFKKECTKRDTSLKDKILKEEKGKLLIKILKCYKKCLETYGNKAFEEWELDYFKKTREEIRKDTNNLYKFLTSAPGDNKIGDDSIWIEHKEGEITDYEEFKREFSKYNKYNGIKYKWNLSSKLTICKEGYNVKKVYICASCYKKSNKDCCENYSIKNRRQKTVIENMRMRKENIELSDI